MNVNSHYKERKVPTKKAMDGVSVRVWHFYPNATHFITGTYCDTFSFKVYWAHPSVAFNIEEDDYVYQYTNVIKWTPW